jgi:hypothetical protein
MAALGFDVTFHTNSYRRDFFLASRSPYVAVTTLLILFSLQRLVACTSVGVDIEAMSARNMAQEESTWYYNPGRPLSGNARR